MSPSQKGKSGHLRGLGWRSCRRLPNQSKSSTALGEGRSRRAFLPELWGPKGSPRALGALGQMQRVVSREGDLTPKAAVLFTPGSSHHPPKPPPPTPAPAKAPCTVQGLKPPSSSRFPGPEMGASPEGQWGAPGGLRGSGLPRPPSLPGTPAAAFPPRARPEPGTRQRPRSPRSSRRPDGARGARHVQGRRGALGAARATAAGGRARGDAPRPKSRVSRGEPPLRNPHPGSGRRASRRASPGDPVLSEPLCAPPPGPPFILGSAPASSATNGSASCRRVTAARTQWRRARRSAAFPN